LRGGELRGCSTAVGVWECGHGEVVMFCEFAKKMDGHIFNVILTRSGP